MAKMPIAGFEIGRGDWIRTSDPLRPRQVRYQAALRPDKRNVPGFNILTDFFPACPGHRPRADSRHQLISKKELFLFS